MGVIIDGLPAMLGRDRNQLLAAETLTTDIWLNLQSVRSSSFGSGEHLRSLNSSRFAEILTVRGRHDLWQAVALADAAATELEKRPNRAEVKISDPAVRRMATAAQALQRYTVERTVWLRAFQIDLAGLITLIVVISSVVLREGRWPYNVQSALPTYVGAGISLILATDIIAWIRTRLVRRDMSSLYKPFAPFRNPFEATLSGVGFES